MIHLALEHNCRPHPWKRSREVQLEPEHCVGVWACRQYSPNTALDIDHRAVRLSNYSSASRHTASQGQSHNSPWCTKNTPAQRNIVSGDGIMYIPVGQLPGALSEELVSVPRNTQSFRGPPTCQCKDPHSLLYGQLGRQQRLEGLWHEVLSLPKVEVSRDDARRGRAWWR